MLEGGDGEHRVEGMDAEQPRELVRITDDIDALSRMNVDAKRRLAQGNRSLLDRVAEPTGREPISSTDSLRVLISERNNSNAWIASVFSRQSAATSGGMRGGSASLGM